MKTLIRVIVLAGVLRIVLVIAGCAATQDPAAQFVDLETRYAQDAARLAGWRKTHPADVTLMALDDLAYSKIKAARDNSDASHIAAIQIALTAYEAELSAKGVSP